jgi:hypothetical protein
MPQSLDQLIAALDFVREDLAAAEAEHADAVDAVAPSHRRGAVNLVRYRTLQRHDRRELQNELMDIGATSLSTTEARVQAKLHAARDVLAALRGAQRGRRRRQARLGAHGRERPRRSRRRRTTDPGAAAAQRAECVMLNKGPHIVGAIQALDAILARMGEVQRKSRTPMRHIHSWDHRCWSCRPSRL